MLHICQLVTECIMNMIKIRPYKSADYKNLKEFMEKLQDFLLKLDPYKLLRRTKEYGRLYTNETLEKIKKNKGEIYLAEIEVTKGNKKIIGCIAGMIKKPTKMDNIDHFPIIRGRILELFVEQDIRGKNVGTLLMKEMEKYFKKNKCNIIKVEVFKPNVRAHRFYEKCGYEERLIDMVKKI